MTEREWLSTADWYASLPAVYVAAGALITDPAGRVLLVKPNYRPYWLFPGGVVETDESPHEGCAREVSEELGLDVRPGPLLVVDWTRAEPDRPRSSVYFLFDGGQVDPDTPIRLQNEELDDYAFVTVREGVGMLATAAAHRLSHAWHARRSGATRYLPTAAPDADAADYRA